MANWSGVGSGAVAGAGVGASFGGQGGAVIGGVVGGLAGLLSRKRKRSKPQILDITQELAQIGEMYNMARAQQKELSGRGQAQALQQTSESLAGRGIYRSPVGEYALGQTRKTYATALADALAELSQQEIGQKAQLSVAAKQFNLGNINAYNTAKDRQSMANQNLLNQGLYSMGSWLLDRGLTPEPKTPQLASYPGEFVTLRQPTPMWEQLVYEPEISKPQNDIVSPWRF